MQVCKNSEFGFWASVKGINYYIKGHLGKHGKVWRCAVWAQGSMTSEATGTEAHTHITPTYEELPRKLQASYFDMLSLSKRSVLSGCSREWWTLFWSLIDITLEAFQNREIVLALWVQCKQEERVWGWRRRRQCGGTGVNSSTLCLSVALHLWARHSLRLFGPLASSWKESCTKLLDASEGEVNEWSGQHGWQGVPGWVTVWLNSIAQRHPY